MSVDAEGYQTASSWSGSEAQRRHHGYRRKPNPDNTLTVYQVEFSTPCRIRKIDGTETTSSWTPYLTRSLQQFTAEETATVGWWYIFTRGGYQLKVWLDKVRRVPVPAPQEDDHR